MSAVPKLADKKSLKNLVPLNELSVTHFEELAKKANLIHLKPGKYLFKKGERDNATCFILEGEIALVDGSDIKLTIVGGSEEARHPIVPQQPRQLAARAKSHCTVVSFDSGLLDVMLAWEQSSGYEVDDMDSDDEDWMTRMMQSDLMQNLPASNLQQLFMRMEEMEVKAGEVIVNQDEEGDYYYIIKKGTCIVSRRPSANAREVKLAELKDGESFGEESLLSGGKRNASVTMLTNGSLMRLSKEDFNELLKAPLLSQVTYSEAKKLVKEGAVYMDVRLPGEYSNASLPGSINLPLAAIRTEMTSIDRSKEYIVYCDTGRRSTSAVFLLGQYGIDAHVLKDGLASVPLEDYTSEDVKSGAGADIIDINRDRTDGHDARSAAELKQLKKDKARLEKDIGRLEAEIEKFRSQVTKSKSTVNQHETELKEARAELAQEQEHIRNLEEELQGLRDIEVESDKLREQLRKSQDAIADKEKLLDTVQQSDETAQKKLLSQQEKIEKLEKALQDAESKAQQAQQNQNSNINELEALQSELQTLKSEKITLTEKISGLEREKESLGRDVDASVAALNDELTALRTSMDELQQGRSGIEQQLQQEREQHKLLKNQLQDKVSEHVNLESRIGELNRLLESEKSKAMEMQSDYNARIVELQDLRKQLDQDHRTTQEQATGLQQQIHDFEQQNNSLQQQLKDAQEHVSRLQKDLEQQASEKDSIASSSESNLQELRSRLTETEQQRNQLESEISVLNGKIEGYESSLTRLKETSEQDRNARLERIKELEKELSKTGSEHASEMSRLQAQLADFGDNRRQQEAEIKRLKDSAAKSEAMYATEKQVLESENRESKQAMEKLSAQLDTLQKQKDETENALQAQLSSSEQRLQQQAQELESAREAESKLSSELQKNETQSAQQRERIAELESELSSTQDKLSNLESMRQDLDSQVSRFQQQLTATDDEKRELQSRLEAMEAEISELKSGAEASAQESEKRIIEYRQKLELQQIEHAAVEERYQRAQKRIDELVQINTQLESGASDEAMHNELVGLRQALNEAEERLQQNTTSLAEKTQESEQALRELAALRAMYAQKEDDLSRLRGELDEFRQQDGDSQQQRDALERELQELRQQHEQAQEESSKLVATLRSELQEKDSQIESIRTEASEGQSQLEDARSVSKSMEEELESLRGDASGYQEQMQSLQQELDALREEQKEWRVTEEDLARSNEVELAQARIAVLEEELEHAQARILEMEGDKGQEDQRNHAIEMQQQIEQLKKEMEVQLQQHKAEYEDRSAQLSKENQKLHEELEAAHKQHEATLEEFQQAQDELKQKSARDHSELFDLPNIDKNLFAANNKAQPVGNKGSKVVTLFMVILFSVLSSAAVYWYFVMRPQGMALPDLAIPGLNESSQKSSVDSMAEKSSTPARTVAADEKPKAPGKPAAKAVSKEKDKKADNGVLKPTRVFSDFLKSGGSGPVMVGVPGGIFTMGSPDNSPHFDERPQHKVSIKKYSISRFEVTFEDYDRFARDSGRARPSDSGWGRGKRPVINVSWEDAVAYTQWLSAQTGQQYRLPTEAEWEYAARAGSEDKYWWGAKYLKNRANCFDCGSQWDRVSSAPVGSFAASSLGLHDVSGNVMEWVSDCYHKDFNGAPIDGSAWEAQGCSSHVARGGSYRSTKDNIRITKRTEFDAKTRLDEIGFRVVRIH